MVSHPVALHPLTSRTLLVGVMPAEDVGTRICTVSNGGNTLSVSTLFSFGLIKVLWLYYYNLSYNLLSDSIS